jgi:hypothetical protein
MAYDKGDLVRCTATFKDATNNDTLVDPSTIQFKFKTPAGATTTYTYGTDAQLVKDSTGQYHVDLNANAAGTWSYQFSSTGTYQAAQEQQFTVLAGQF